MGLTEAWTQQKTEVVNSKTGEQKISQGKHTEKKEWKTEQSIAGMCDMIKRSNIWVTEVPERKKKQRQIKKKLEIKTKNFPPRMRGSSHKNQVCASHHWAHAPKQCQGMCYE